METTTTTTSTAIISSRVDKQWNAMFQTLTKFRQRNGHCFVPHGYGMLGRWCRNQRTAYKLNRNGSTKTLLNPAKIELMNSQGFNWFHESKREKHWHDMYHALVKYKEEHGHCNVPKNKLLVMIRVANANANHLNKVEDDLQQKLGSWVSYQRVLYRNHRKALQQADGPTNQNNKNDDDDIQVDVTVEQRVNVKVNQRKKSSPSRCRYRCSSAALNLNRIRLLNQIGFCWFDDGSPPSPPTADCSLSSHPKQGSPTTCTSTAGGTTNESGEEEVGTRQSAPPRSTTTNTNTSISSVNNNNNNNASPHRTTTMRVVSVQQHPQSHGIYSERHRSIAAHHHHQGIEAGGYECLNLYSTPTPSQAAGTVIVTSSLVPAQFILTVPPTPVRQQPMLVRMNPPSSSYCSVVCDGTTSTAPNVVQNIVYVVSTPQP